MVKSVAALTIGVLISIVVDITNICSCANQHRHIVLAAAVAAESPELEEESVVTSATSADAAATGLWLYYLFSSEAREMYN